MLTRRHLIALSAAQVVAPNLLIGAARAQSGFPDRPVHLIVPVAAGGPTDIVARMLGDKLSRMWGQQVVVENKGGAGTNLGNEYVARSDPDGYTMLFATSSLAVNTSLYQKLNYNPIADFEPVSLVTKLAYFMFVPNSSPAHSLKEFIAYAKSNPGKLTMASPGTGSAPYLAEMVFLQMANLKMTHVPYRGASPAFVDLIPGRVNAYFGSGALLSYSRSGQVRVLGTTGAEAGRGRAGCAHLRRGRRTGLRRNRVAGGVPAGEDPARPSSTRSASIPRPRSPIRRSRTSSPKPGYVAGGSSPAELETLLKSEITKWSGVIKSIGLKIK